MVPGEESKKKQQDARTEKYVRDLRADTGLPHLRHIMMSRLEENATGLAQEASLYRQSRKQEVCTAQGFVEMSVTREPDEMDGDLAFCKKNED